MDNKRRASDPLDRILTALPSILAAVACVAIIHEFVDSWAIELLTAILAWLDPSGKAGTQVPERRIEKALDPNAPEDV